MSDHATPFYDEEFPDTAVSIFGYFEIEEIKKFQENQQNQDAKEKYSANKQDLKGKKIDARF